MLEFTNYPPRTLEDIVLSKSGTTLLERNRGGDNSWDRLDALGQAAFLELVDAFPVPPDEDFLAAIGKVGTQVTAVLDSDTTPFLNGMSSARIRHLEQGVAELERGVAA